MPAHNKENFPATEHIYASPKVPPRPVFTPNKSKVNKKAPPPVSPKPPLPHGRVLRDTNIYNLQSIQQSRVQIDKERVSGKSPSKSNNVEQSTGVCPPSSMKEWMQHQRRLKEEPSVPQNEQIRNSSSQEIFKQAPSYQQIDKALDQYISTHAAGCPPYDNTNRGTNFNRGMSSSREALHSGLNQDQSFMKPVTGRQYSNNIPEPCHVRTPSSPVQFVKPLAPTYPLTAKKNISMASSVSLSSSPQRGNETYGRPRCTSVSVPCSPRKTSAPTAHSVSYDELSVVVSDPHIARNASASSLTVLSPNTRSTVRNESLAQSSYYMCEESSILGYSVEDVNSSQNDAKMLDSASLDRTMDNQCDQGNYFSSLLLSGSLLL